MVSRRDDGFRVTLEVPVTADCPFDPLNENVQVALMTALLPPLLASDAVVSVRSPAVHDPLVAPVYMDEPACADTSPLRAIDLAVTAASPPAERADDAGTRHGLADLVGTGGHPRGE